MSSFTAHLCAILLASSALAQTPATQKRLEALRQGYEGAVARHAGTAFTTSVKELNMKYLSALDRFITSATQAGRLDEAITLRDEKKRINEGMPLPETDADAPETLRPLRTTYRQQLAAFTATRDNSAAPVKKRYLEELDRLQADCAKAGLLDDAIAVRAAREQLSGNETTEQATISNGPVTDSLKKASKVKTDPNRTRLLLEWCVREKVRVRLIEGGKMINYDRITELPKKEAKVLQIINHSFSGGLDFAQPTEAFPWQLLAEGAPEIERLEIWSLAPLGAADVKAISQLSRLQHLLIKAPDSSDEVFLSMPIMPLVSQFDFKSGGPNAEATVRFLLSRFPNLNNFSTAVGFKDSETGKALGALPHLGTLHMSNAGVDGGFFTALGAASRLSRLMIFSADPGAATSSLASIKSLEGLILHCPTSAPDLFETFTLLPKLRWVTVSLAGRTHQELQKLTRLKQLETIRLRDIPDDSAPYFEALLEARGLRRLSLSGPGVRDDVVSKLKGLKRLEELSVENSAVGRDTLNNLVKAMPKLKIVASVGPWN